MARDAAMAYTARPGPSATEQPASSGESDYSTLNIFTLDPFEALDISSALFFPHRYTSIGTSPFSWGINVAVLDALTVGRVSLGGEIAVKNDELGSYHVRAPLVGQLRSTTRSGEIFASPTNAAIYRPDDKTTLTCLQGETVIWLLKFKAIALERHLSALLGRPVSDTVDFAPNLDLTSQPGATFWAFTEALRNPRTIATLAAVPMVSKPYVEMVANALLCCVTHRYSEELAAPAHRAPLPSVTRAVELIRESPRHSWTVASLATASFCSVRSLQAGFSSELGTTPLRYLASIRMQGAHRDLLSGSPHQVTVSAIATDWGFSHLGRFSAAHEKTYGELPSRALHRTR